MKMSAILFYLFPKRLDGVVVWRVGGQLIDRQTIRIVIKIFFASDEVWYFAPSWMSKI